MVMNAGSIVTMKVADEVFVAVADLHRSHPGAIDFSFAEIVEHAKALGLNADRPGFATHVRAHCVAELPPNPGAYRILSRSGSRRRLFGPGDPVHRARSGKIFPDPADLPERFRELVEW